MDDGSFDGRRACYSGILFCSGHMRAMWPQYRMEDDIVILYVFTLSVVKAMALLEYDVVWRSVNRVQS